MTKNQGCAPTTISSWFSCLVMLAGITMGLSSGIVRADTGAATTDKPVFSYYQSAGLGLGTITLDVSSDGAFRMFSGAPTVDRESFNPPSEPERRGIALSEGTLAEQDRARINSIRDKLCRARADLKPFTPYMDFALSPSTYYILVCEDVGQIGIYDFQIPDEFAREVDIAVGQIMDSSSAASHKLVKLDARVTSIQRQGDAYRIEIHLSNSGDKSITIDCANCWITGPFSFLAIRDAGRQSSDAPLFLLGDVTGAIPPTTLTMPARTEKSFIVVAQSSTPLKTGTMHPVGGGRLNMSSKELSLYGQGMGFYFLDSSVEIP